MLFMKVILPIFPAAAFFSAASKSELPGYDFFLHQRRRFAPGHERRKSVCCVVQYVIDRFPDCCLPGVGLGIDVACASSILFRKCGEYRIRTDDPLLAKQVL